MSKIIKIDTKNFNKHTTQGMNLLEKSIAEVGAIESICLDKNGEIITGNARFETFEKLGYKPKVIKLAENEYPVIATELEGEKRTRAAIYANTTPFKNINLDYNLIQEVAVEEYDIDITELGVVDKQNNETTNNKLVNLNDLYKDEQPEIIENDSVFDPTNKEIALNVSGKFYDEVHKEIRKKIKPDFEITEEYEALSMYIMMYYKYCRSLKPNKRMSVIVPLPLNYCKEYSISQDELIRKFQDYMYERYNK